MKICENLADKAKTLQEFRKIMNSNSNRELGSTDIDNKVRNSGYTTTPRSITTFMNYVDSVGMIERENIEIGACPIGIGDSIKEYTGVQLDFFIETHSYMDPIYVCETLNDSEKRFVKMNRQENRDDFETIASYIEYLTFLAIYCKLKNIRVQLMRNDVTQEALIEDDTFFDSRNFSIVQGNEKGDITLPNDIKVLKKECADSMSLEAISDLELTQYEFRKMISLKYMELGNRYTEEEIQSLNLYKHGYFDKINGMLRGDFSELKISDISKIVDIILNMSSALQKSETQEELLLLRTDYRAEKEDGRIQYENFVSTSITPQLFRYRMDGVDITAFMLISIPKGTHIIPMDIVTEKKIDYSNSISVCNSGDTGFDEGEFLLPMCEIELGNRIGNNFRESSLVRELDVTSILRSRLKELKDKIIKELGEKAYEELLGEIDKFSSNIPRDSFEEDKNPLEKITLSTHLGCLEKSELSALKERADELENEKHKLDVRYKKILEAEKELSAEHPELFAGMEKEEANIGE